MQAWLLVGLAAAVAGFSRGFAAFGTAMIYVPLVTLAYDAKTAVVTLFLVDLLPSVPLVRTAARDCEWRPTILCMALGAAALSPVGVILLLMVPARDVMAILGLVLIAATSYLLLGPRLHLAGGAGQSLIAGAVSGLAGGICGIFGPPAMIYLLGRQSDAATTRANAVIFLTGESLLLGATYLLYGMVTRRMLVLAVVLMPLYGACLWLGAHSFAGVSDVLYRRLVLGLLWLVAAAILIHALLAL
ncbi:sulfite exporter TauE/SafE family protein [Acidisoma cellulosilytica]|uniref:Probable membrane transporter protein n=1 Tax=Acidisoma cellulosilyticum TaxID=2802395 RepID=A0A964E2T9_9PROT|nr:sulfite exporter TauE/SafE family protein [Acidisoma cellulosilyticum]MCB8879572.1 sulfite exporter TauE/SafE family protein [Acidisoma cellulosilyticum]